MSTETARLTIINNTGDNLNGTIVHTSGNGKNKIADPAINIDDLPEGGFTTKNIKIRTNHDDYFDFDLSINSSEEKGKMHKRIKEADSDAYMIISEKGLMLVTQENGWEGKGF